MSIRSDLPIIFVTHEFFPRRGGIATFTEEIARGAAANGREVEVWAPHSDSISGRDFPFAVRQLPLKGSQDPICQFQLAREWVGCREKIRRSIVCLTDPGPILAMRYLQFFSALAPARLVLSFHGSEIIKFGSNRYSKFLIARIIEKSHRIGVLSSYSQNLLSRYFPESKGKVRVTPGALRSSFRIPEEKQKRTGGDLVILTVGRLHPRKGQAETMEALAALPQSIREQIEFWIVGTGTKYGYGESLKRQASQSGFRVKFFGKVSDEKLQRLYSKADIFSMTSINFRKSVEGFGLVYLEAAAHGLPIIANRVGGVAEAVSHMENGILVKPHDKPSLVSAFRQLIQDSALREKMGRSGRSLAQRNTWEETAKRLFEGLETDQ